MAGRQGGYEADEDDDALPWLEPAELDDDDDEDGGFPYRSLVVAGFAIVAVVALLWFVADRFGGRGTEEIAATDEVPLIQAPEGPYKVRPNDPGGLQVDADSRVHAVAEGADPGSQIALDALPEEPMPVAQPPVRRTAVPAPASASPKPQTAGQAQVAADNAVKREPTPLAKVPVAPPSAAPEAATVKVPAPKPVQAKPAPEPQAPKPQPASGGSVTVQLGAFGSAASADQVWSKLSGRVPALGALRKSVQPVETGGKTFFRLRAGGIASAAEASAICAKVQAAGEQCAVVR